MKKYRTGMMLAIVLGFLASAGLATPCLAERRRQRRLHQGRIHRRRWWRAGRTWLPRQAVSLHGVGHERGLHDRRLNQQVCWQGLNLRSPGDLAGSYAVGGAGGALRAACFWISFAVGSSSSIFSGMADPSSMTVAPEPIASAGGDIAPLIQIKRSQRGALLI